MIAKLTANNDENRQPVLPAIPAQFRAEEIKQTAFRLDGILVPPEQSPELPIVFVEVQFQPDADFYGRFFAEIFLYLYRCQPSHPWQAVVIYPDRSCEQADRHYASLLDMAEVHRIYLEDFHGKPANTLGVQLIQIIISGTEEALARARALDNRLNKIILIPPSVPKLWILLKPS